MKRALLMALLGCACAQAEVSVAPLTTAIVTPPDATALHAEIAQLSLEPLAPLKTSISALARIPTVQVSLVLADTAAWNALADFLAPPDAKPNRPQSSNWIDAGKERLRKRIAKEGYTPEILSEAQALILKANQK